MTLTSTGTMPMRIRRARMTFHALPTSPERASAIVHRALRQLVELGAARPPSAPRDVQLTVRVPHGASDAAIAARVAEALRRRFGRATGT